MSETNSNQPAPEVIDPFKIFNTKIEDIKSFEEPAAREKIDWDKHFFEPDPKNAKDGKMYQVLIKLVPNIYDPRNPVVYKDSYKIPSPNNPKFSITWDSPTSVGRKDCICMQRYFWSKDSKDPRIVEIGKNGLKRKQRGCFVMQIVNDLNHPENNGKIFLHRFTKGFEIETLIKSKLYPTADDIATGKKPEDVFDPFYSRYMIMKVYMDDKGRNFSLSEWTDSDVKGGMLIDGKPIGKDDATNPEIQKKIVELLQHPDVNIKELFAYKEATPEKIAFVERALRVMFGEEAPGNAAGAPQAQAPNASTTDPGATGQAPQTGTPVTTSAVPATPVTGQIPATDASQTPAAPVQNGTTPATPAATTPVVTEQPAQTGTAPVTPAAQSNEEFLAQLGLK